MKAPSNLNVAPYANESATHFADKLSLSRLYAKCGFNFVFLEHCHSDVLGQRRCGEHHILIAGEVQHSPRNLLPNLERNCRQGAIGTVVACRDFGVMAAVARKLARSLPLSLKSRVGLTNLTALQLLLEDFPDNHSTDEGTHAHS